VSATPPIPAAIAGYFDKAGNPCLTIGLRGVYSPTPVEFEAIIDTGFTGFLSMPLIKAFPLGLPLHGTTAVTLADGSTSYKLLGHAKATLNNQTKEGLVILEPSSSDILLGMAFLRTFKLMLMVAQMGVGLIDEMVLDAIIKQAQARAQGDSAAHPESAPPVGTTGFDPDTKA